MAKRKFELTEQERVKLFQAYELCKDGPNRTRYQAVKLYSGGYLEKEIEQITGCSRSSLLEWVPLFSRRPFARAAGRCWMNLVN
jgi:hypothetical protein